MAISETQKVDYLWKKLAYGRAKTDTNANKKATNESISSPLLLRGNNVWSQADLIPGVMPASTTGVVTVYPTSAPDETTADVTATASRTWKTGLTDWIPPEIGSTYLVKVYIHTSSDASNAAGSGTQVFGAGSGNNDEWFFDYQAGTLHFVGTNLPSGVSFSGKSVYVSGARYTGIKGVAVPGATADFTDVTLTDTDTGSSAGPELKLYRNSATPADADYLGQIKFAGESDTGVERNYAKITGKISDASNTAEDGIIEFAHIKAGTQTITGRWNSTTLQLLNGTILTGNVTGDLTGNADTATALETARNIGGVSFDGTAAITLPGVNAAGNQDTSGNAATATALATARNIGGVSFDGTAAINLPGVNASGNQDTSGNAATATALATARNIGGVSFDGTAAITLPGVNAAGNQDTSGTAALASGLTGAPSITVNDLTVNGTTTTINSTTLTVDDKNIELGSVTTPSDSTANGGGITLKGTSDKTFNWVDSTDSWTSSEHLDLANTKGYKLNGTTVLSGTTLGSAIVTSSLTSLGTITTGVWNGTAIANANLANSTMSVGGVTLTLGGTSATPAFDLTSATNYPTSSLTGTITNAQLAGSIANDKLAGSIANDKLANSSVSFGGISLALGASDATPAFDLSDATNYPTSSLTGTITNAQLAGSIANDKLAGSIVDSKLSTISTANKVSIAALDIDGGTDIGADIVDADLFIIDDGAGGTNKKVTASRIKSYIGSGAQVGTTNLSTTSATDCGNFVLATYRSASVIAQITQGTSYQVGRYLLIHDGTTVTTIEESAIATGDMLGAFEGVINGSNVEFRVTMDSSSSATVITNITLIDV